MLESAREPDFNEWFIFFSKILIKQKSWGKEISEQSFGLAGKQTKLFCSLTIENLPKGMILLP